MSLRSVFAGLCCASAMLALTGCATVASQRYHAIVNADKSIIAQAKACNRKIYDSPAFDILRPHIPLNVDDATLQQLSDPSKATDQEIKALLHVHPKVVACRKTVLNRLAKLTPTFVPIFADVYMKDDNADIALIKKKITWGDYTQRRRSITATGRKQLTAASQHLTEELQRSNAAEIRRRQQALNAYQQYMQRQEMINSLNRPVTTNCTSLGYSVNCVTQ